MKGEKVMSEQVNQNLAAVTTFREDGNSASFEGTPAITDLAAFLRDVHWDGKPRTYEFFYDESRLLAKDYTKQSAYLDCWKLNGEWHRLVGIGLTYGEETAQVGEEDEDPILLRYVVCAEGDAFRVTLTPDTVDVTEPAKWEPYMYDYAADGKLLRGIPSRMVFVGAEADLEDLPNGYLPGTIAATIGFGNMWQLDGDGEWQPIGTEGEE